MAFRPSFRVDSPLRAYRIADQRNRIFDGTGALIWGARWNSPGRRVIYAAETYAGAVLEILAHASGSVPATQAWVEIVIPTTVTVERLEGAALPGWDAIDSPAAREFGDRWYDERRTPVLIVPSVVTRVESNVLINPDHPDAGQIRVSEPRPVIWDERLWPRR